jgi:thymidylate synthase (FAD)
MRKSKYVPTDIHLRLRSFTEMIKATYIDHMGSDLSVVNAARVSFGKKSSAVEWGWIDIEYRSGELVAILNEQDTKLIHYLAKHKHMSPFGHAFASFHVKAPIFVARQLVKHKFLRWNEISRRYVDDEPEFYVPHVWRGRSKDKKQGSDGVVDLGDLQEEYPIEVQAMIQFYDMLLETGVAPEQARMVLPQSTLTEWYWSGSLDAFADMCRLRCKDDTQYETRLVADQISEIMKDLFPVSWDALTKEIRDE